MPPRAPITRTLVFGRARDLVNERGADALTMRALATELGIEAPSLYKHVSGKDEILDGICDLIYSDISVDLTGKDTWESRLREYCNAYRRALIMNSHCVPILAIRPVATESAMAVVEVTLQEFHDAGFDSGTGWQLLNVIAGTIVGHVLAEVGDEPATADMQEHLANFRQTFDRNNYPLAARTIGSNPANRDAEFQLAMDVLIAGAKVMFPDILREQPKEAEMAAPGPS